MSSSTTMKKKWKKVTNVQLISNDVCEAPDFKAIPEVPYKGDLAGALSSISPTVLMINKVRNCYMCKIREIGDLEIRETYEKPCDNGALIDKYKNVEKKGLTQALDFSQLF